MRFLAKTSIAKVSAALLFSGTVPESGLPTSFLDGPISDRRSTPPGILVLKIRALDNNRHVIRKHFQRSIRTHYNTYVQSWVSVGVGMDHDLAEKFDFRVPDNG